jgi:hypothetical protein
VREQKLKTPTNAFGHIGYFAGQFNDLIHKNRIDGI